MKLINMTDFVLEQEEGFNIGKIGWKEYTNNTINYAKLLKQPLELWMFVPCDKEGDVLEHPNYFKTCNSDFNNFNYADYCLEYQQAKEVCIFYGCVYDDEMEVVRSQDGENIFYITQKQLWDIESAIQYNLELTKTAQKQLGL